MVANMLKLFVRSNETTLFSLGTITVIHFQKIEGERAIDTISLARSDRGSYIASTMDAPFLYRNKVSNDTNLSNIRLLRKY